MKEFFDKFGLLVLGTLLAIFMVTTISKTFTLGTGLVCLIVIIVVAIVTVAKFRRYPVPVCMIISLIMFMIIVVLQVSFVSSSNGETVVKTAVTLAMASTAKPTVVPVIREVEKIIERIEYVATPSSTLAATPAVIPKVIPEVAKITSVIKFADKINGATEIFATVTLSEAGNIIIESNVNYEVKKISNTVYYVIMQVVEDSNGTAAISVTGSNVETNEATTEY